MRIRTINIIEIFLGLVFSISYFLTKYDVAHLIWITFSSAMLLGVFYFPLGFYTLRAPNSNIASSIAAGALYSVSLVVIIFNMLKVDISMILLSLFIIIYPMSFIAAFSFYIFKRQKGQTIQYDNGLIIRGVGLFFYLLFAYYTYKPQF
jgi:hypothetical protein